MKKDEQHRLPEYKESIFGDPVRYKPPSGDTTEFVDFDPNNIASRFARFNPRLKPPANDK